MIGYVAPAFPLYEFAPPEPEPHPGPEPESPAEEAERRWLCHWDGRIGEAAQGVVLAWASAASSTHDAGGANHPDAPGVSARALVCTTAETFDPAYARFRAAHLALGGTFLPAASRPSGPSRIARELERLRADDAAWAPVPGLLPGAVRAEAAEQGAYTIAYALFGGGAVFVAALGIPAVRLGIRVARP